METIKTAVVVTCLLGVLYGVYTILNKPEHQPPPEVAQAWDEGEISTDIDIDFDLPDDYAVEPGAESIPMEGELGITIPEPPPGVAAAGQGPPPLPAPGDLSLPAGVGSPADMPLSNTPPSDPTSPAAGPAADPALAVDSSAQADLAPPSDIALPSDIGPPSDTPPPSDTGPLNSLAPLDPPPALATPQAGSPEFDSQAAAPPLSQPPVDTTPLAGAEGAPATDPADAVVSVPDGGTVLLDSPAQAPPTTSADTAAAEPPIRPFERARRTALSQIDDGQLEQALFTLSLFYKDPDLTPDEHRQLLDLLDPLAGRVIYSREHLLTSAHVTQAGETIEDIAAKYQVPAKLLININGLQRPELLTSGTELKVVPGPFRAQIDLERGEMTLFLRRLYAGRFPISVGNDPTPKAGDFEIKEKKPGQTYYAAGGSPIDAANPQNPYGRHWMDLGGLSLHGSPQSPAGLSSGCISLSPGDAEDVYNILTVGSKVTLMR